MPSRARRFRQPCRISIGPLHWEACRDAMPRGEGILLGVTVLTSLGDDDLAEVGFAQGSETSVLRLARLAQDAGLDGVVASPREIRAIREACGPDFVILTPGIRGADDAAGDQKRTMSAKEAVEAGASYVVVGRPITEAQDPRAAAAAIWDGSR